ncbi:aromatic amino acid ammonia-lyase [Streptomyces sp. NPDC059582]|uniref:aromatic amino acid ammonia-lyase n=1 Tax=Streptomyces sp. NPDC059582 TaxID=3346875 RepID=UPI003684BC07
MTDPTQPPARPGPVVLDGTTLTVGELIRLADGAAVPEVAPEARERAVRSWRTAQHLAATGRLYGRGTGVGAARSVLVDEADEAAHGLRLLRSHAGGAGSLLPARQIRAMLAIRANQLLAGGSGVQPAFADALAEALRLGVHPAVNEYGGLGTGDLTALAQTALTLIGERPWLSDPLPGATEERPGGAAATARPAAGQPWGSGPDIAPPPGAGDGPASATPTSVGLQPAEGTRTSPAAGQAWTAGPSDGASAAAVAVRHGEPAADQARRGAATAGVGRLPAPVVPQAGDALALLSSNALALAQAAVGWHEVDVLLRATHAVAALSLAAVSGSLEAYAEPVHALRPYPGAARTAAEVLRLLSGAADRPRPGDGRRVQDPFGFRVFPQVHGCALDAADGLRRVVEVEVNCPSENPLVTPGGTRAHHHGGFFAAPLGLALDGLNLALLGTARLSAARLTALGDADLTGLPAYLAAGAAGSSGIMILEYTANSALAELRSCAAPASAGHTVVSRGLEEAASFATQAARQTLRAADAHRTVLACELVVAVRALRMHPVPPPLPALLLAGAALPADTDDRPLTADVTAATELLPLLAEL